MAQLKHHLVEEFGVLLLTFSTEKNPWPNRSTTNGEDGALEWATFHGEESVAQLKLPGDIYRAGRCRCFHGEESVAQLKHGGRRNIDRHAR